MLDAGSSLHALSSETHSPAHLPRRPRTSSARRRWWLSGPCESQPCMDPARSKWPGQQLQQQGWGWAGPQRVDARQLVLAAAVSSNSHAPAIITLSNGSKSAHDCNTVHTPAAVRPELVQQLLPRTSHDNMPHSQASHEAIPWQLPQQPLEEQQAAAASQPFLDTSLVDAAQFASHGVVSVQHQELGSRSSDWPAGVPLQAEQQQHAGISEPWPGGHERYSGAHIMGIIKHRRSLGELRQALHKYSDHLNMMHAAAACTHAAQLLSQQPQQQQQRDAAGAQALVLQLLLLQREHLHAFGARQVANSLWALSKLLQPGRGGAADRGLLQRGYHSSNVQHPQEQQQLQQLQQEVLQGLLDQLPRTLPQMRAQEVANTWYALARLQPVCAAPASLVAPLMQACSSQWGLFKPQELANLLWAAANLLPQGLSSSNNTSSSASSSSSCGQAGVCIADVQPWVQSLMQTHMQQLHQLAPVELSSSCWALGRLWPVLGHTYGQQAMPGQPTDAGHPTHGLNGHALPLQPVNHSTASSDAGSTQPWQVQQLSQHGTEAASWAPWPNAVCAALASCPMQQLGAWEVVSVLGALPSLPPHPSHMPLTHSLLLHAEQLSQQGVLTPHEAACVLSAAAQLPVHPNDVSQGWVSTIVQHSLIAHHATHADNSSSNGRSSRHRSSGLEVSCCSADDIWLTLVSLERLQCPPSAHTAQQLLRHSQALLEQGCCSPAQVSALLWACARLRLLPPASFLAMFQKASYAAAPHMAPCQVAAMFWALGRLRARPGRKWLQDTLACVWRRRSEYTLGELLQVLSALGRIQYPLTPHMSDQLMAELQPRCSEATPPRELAAALCALCTTPALSQGALQWTVDVLLGELLLPHVPSLPPAELVSLLWAYGRVLRRLRNPALVPAPKQLFGMPQGSSSSNSSITTTTSRGSTEDAGGSTPAPQPRQLSSCDELDEQQLSSSSDLTELQPSCSGVLDAEQLSVSDDSPAGDPQLPHADTAASSGRASRGQGLCRWQLLRKQLVGQQQHPRSDLVSGALWRALQLRHELQPQQVAALLYTLCVLGVQPSGQWVRHLLFARPQLVPSFTAHELALTLFSLGCLRIKPPASWLRACLVQVLQHAPAMNNGMVSGVLRGLSLLEWTPGPAWLSCFVSRVAPLLRDMSPKQLTKVYAAAVDLEPQLAEGWGHMFCNIMQGATADDAQSPAQQQQQREQRIRMKAL